MKKIPPLLSGLILGQFGLGNLLGLYHPYLRYVCGGFGLFFLIILTVSFLYHWEEARQVMTKPALLSSVATYPMSLILLSSYLKALPFLSFVASWVWWLGLLLDVSLIAVFTYRFVWSYQAERLVPSWTVLYVGIATASLTVGVSGHFYLARFIIIYGLGVSLVLFLLLWQKYRNVSLPEELSAQVFIYAAPFSLLLASSIQVWGETIRPFYLIGLLIVSQFLYVFAFRQLRDIIGKSFHPSWSAMTFPFVISALALKLSLSLLGITNVLSKVWVGLESWLAVILVSYVTYAYLQFLLKTA